VQQNYETPGNYTMLMRDVSDLDENQKPANVKDINEIKKKIFEEISLTEEKVKKMIKEEKDEHGIIDDNIKDYDDRFENPIASINYVLDTKKLNLLEEKLFSKIKYDNNYFYKIYVDFK
jgi:hypothetical protein